MKKLIYIFTLSCICLINKGYGQIQKGLDINGEASNDLFSSVSMPDPNTIGIGARENDGNGANSGHVRIYRWNGSSWIQKGTDINGEATGDNSGESISMPDSNTVAIGAPANSGGALNSGHVRVYAWNGSTWTQKGADINGLASNDNFGFSVSMPDPNTVAVGGFSNDVSGLDAGHVRVFSWNGTAWVLKGTDIYGEVAGDNFGCTVSMPDANTLAVGAMLNDAGGISAGNVRVFIWNGSSWIQKGTNINGIQAGEYLGRALSMADPNTLVAGAPWNSNGAGSYAGQARVFIWNGSNWVQQGLSLEGAQSWDHFGYGVSMPSPNRIAIGSPGNGPGYSKIFSWNGTNWLQSSSTIFGEASGDFSGRYISMPDISTVSIGAPFNSGSGGSSGHARVYSLCSNTSSTLNISTCNSYISTSGNSIWTTSGTYSDTIPNISGCDSLITINLTINNPSAPIGASTQSFCNFAQISDLTATGTAIQWYTAASGGSPLQGTTSLVNGSTYYASQTVSGCESANRFAVNVVISTVSDITTSVSGITITSNNTNASYIWLDCDNNFSVIPLATAQTFTATTNGSYAVQLTQNGCIDTSSCVSITTVGIESMHLENTLVVFQNPTDGFFTLDLGRTENEIIVSITDINGRIIGRENFRNKQLININLNGPSGFYYVTVITEDKQHVIKLIKN